MSAKAPQQRRKRGELGAQLVAHLQKHGDEMLTSDIAQLFGCTGANVSYALRSTVAEGLLRMENRGRGNLYFLPEVEDPNAGTGALDIVVWSDGDVAVQGVRLADDGTVLFTREQLQQLFKHLRTPHLETPA